MNQKVMITMKLKTSSILPSFLPGKQGSRSKCIDIHSLHIS